MASPYTGGKPLPNAAPPAAVSAAQSALNEAFHQQQQTKMPTGGKPIGMQPSHLAQAQRMQPSMIHAPSPGMHPNVPTQVCLNVMHVQPLIFMM